jgi:murein peptide amidase A
MIRRVSRPVLATLASFLVAACSSTAATRPTSTATTPAAATSTSSTTSATSTSTTSTINSTSTSTSSTTSTVPRPGDFLGEETIGTSVQGRPITVIHRGTPGGAVVLVVGVIHGDEDAGLPIVARLSQMPLPPGIDLWLMPMMNPDGQANQVRGNGHGVDLNRNFPWDWQPISHPGNWQYSGTGPASEPETAAFVAFTTRIHPELTLWYHQDLNIISPTKGRDGPLRVKYAQLTGMPMGGISGGIYHGVAGGWMVHTIPKAMSFIIELGPTLPREQVQVHADAVVTIAQMVR